MTDNMRTQNFYWISVKYDLPEKSDFYMVTVRNKETGKLHTEQDLFIIQNDGKKSWCKDGYYYEVTAWAFIPEPFRG